MIVYGVDILMLSSAGVLVRKIKEEPDGTSIQSVDMCWRSCREIRVNNVGLAFTFSASVCDWSIVYVIEARCL